MAKKTKNRRQATSDAAVPVAVRRAVNEASVRQYFAASDPSWRWVLILGLRDLRANASRLGDLAASESPEGATWSDDNYVYGPVVHGLTAAAVNECAQHCEDLFATPKFLRERLDFASRMLSYNAGQVTRFGLGLRQVAEPEVRRLFLVPSSESVRSGLRGSDDPVAHEARIDAGLTRLSDRLRAIANWYATYEDFHVQYKHGLKLAMRPYGNPTSEAVAERRSNVRGGLLAFTSEPITQLLRAPQQQQGMIFPNLIPEARAHLNALVERRAILRYKQSGPEVDLDEVAAISGTVAQLLRIAAVNRVAISTGLDEHGLYRFELPGTERYEAVSVALRLESTPSLDDL